MRSLRGFRFHNYIPKEFRDDARPGDASIRSLPLFRDTHLYGQRPLRQTPIALCETPARIRPQIHGFPAPATQTGAPVDASCRHAPRPPRHNRIATLLTALPNSTVEHRGACAVASPSSHNMLCVSAWCCDVVRDVCISFFPPMAPQ